MPAILEMCEDLVSGTSEDNNHLENNLKIEPKLKVILLFKQMSKNLEVTKQENETICMK